MIHKILLIILTSFSLFSCKNSKQASKYEQIQYIIQKSGFIELPLEFDANIDVLESNYSVNRTSNDTLLFGKDRVYSIIGFLPDTTNYYAFLHLTVGDMLYPTVVTMDKNWQKIDEKIICATGCAGLVQVDVISCYDSVWIYKDLKIKSISKVVGTVEIEDSTSQVLNICNMRTLDGLIDKNGKINITESGVIDCSQ